MTCFSHLTNIFFSISSNDYEQTFWDEIWGCVKYIEIPFDVIWNMPVYMRKIMINKHNLEQSREERSNDNAITFEGSAINTYAAIEQQKQKNMGTN